MLTFTFAPLVTVVLESISSAEIVGAAPLKLDAPINLRLSVLLRVNALEALLIVESAVQVLPSEVYCQEPFVPSAV